MSKGPQVLLSLILVSPDAEILWYCQFQIALIPKEIDFGICSFENLTYHEIIVLITSEVFIESLKFLVCWRQIVSPPVKCWVLPDPKLFDVFNLMLLPKEDFEKHRNFGKHLKAKNYPEKIPNMQIENVKRSLNLNIRHVLPSSFLCTIHTRFQR